MDEKDEKAIALGAETKEFAKQPLDPSQSKGALTGTVKLIDGDAVVLVPTPSADPKVGKVIHVLQTALLFVLGLC